MQVEDSSSGNCYQAADTERTLVSSVENTDITCSLEKSTLEYFNQTVEECSQDGSTKSDDNNVFMERPSLKTSEDVWQEDNGAVSIIYADLVFDEGSSTSCHKAYCVFDEGENAKERLFQQEASYENIDYSEEFVELISDSENDSDGSSHSYVDIEDEIKIESHRCRTSTFGEGPYWKVKPDEPLPVKRDRRCNRKENSKLSCTGMTILCESNRLVIVTSNGEIIVFESSGSFIFLKDFPEHFEDVTSLPGDEIAASCGFSIKFFKVDDSRIDERQDQCIDYQLKGDTTIHALHYIFNLKKMLVTCNLQTVNPRPFVGLLDMKGKLLKKISIPGLLFPKHISCSSDGKNIFLTDEGRKIITALDGNGHIKWEISNVYAANSLTIAADKTLIVTYDGLSSFKCFSFDGKVRKTIETDVDKTLSPFLIDCLATRNLLLFCPMEHVVGSKDFIYSLKLKTSKRKRISSFLFAKT